MVLQASGRGRPILAVQAVKFARRFGRRNDQRFGVGEGAPFLCQKERIRVDSRDRRQGALQFKTFAVVARETNGMDLGHPQGRQIIENGARAAGLRTNAHHIMHRQTGLDGNLLPGGINFKVAVQAKIAGDGDAQPPIFSGERQEARLGQAAGFFLVTH